MSVESAKMKMGAVVGFFTRMDDAKSGNKHAVTVADIPSEALEPATEHVRALFESMCAKDWKDYSASISSDQRYPGTFAVTISAVRK